jgi:transcriptional regulator with XRE-family HTH domain
MLKQDSFYKQLAERIRKARTDAGLTLGELNEKSGLGLSKGSFSAMENGKQQISAYQLYCISRALHIPIDKLVGENSKKIDISEDDFKKINEA